MRGTPEWADAVRRAAEAAPPLTADQRTLIRLLFRRSRRTETRRAA